MFKIPDFDDDVPHQTDPNYYKKSTTPNGKITNSRAAREHKTTMIKKKNIKTTKSSIVKAKDKLIKLSKYDVQKNLKLNISRNSSDQARKLRKSMTSKHKQSMNESINSISQNSHKTNKLVENSNSNNKLKSKKSSDSAVSSAEWLESNCLRTGTVKSNREKRKQKMEDFDEQLLEVGKKTLNESISREDQAAQLLFTAHKPLTKKEKLKSMLLGKSSHRNSIRVPPGTLRERMQEQLRAAQFRYLNEKLYTCSGQEAQQLFQADPAAFRTYHAGYRQQLRKWPLNPLHVLAKRIKEFPKSYVIADMGCGEGALGTLVPHTVHAFDLVAASARVTACDMAHTPLPAGAVHVAVYCLALMGTQLTDYLLEANRILKDGGRLLIAEVASRFDSAEQFARGVAQLGFALVRLDEAHPVFCFLEFVKNRAAPTKKAKLPHLTLKPCLYKPR